MAASKARISFLIILGALMSITSLSTDIYLPALPTMEATLGGDSELTITGFLVGFSLAQLLWGPISDRIGRKIPLIIGIILFIIGSIGCATSTNMTMVVFWRVFQALGACVGPMLSRAMIRDSYGVTEAARTLSTLAMIMAVAPIAGPLLGGDRDVETHFLGHGRHGHNLLWNNISIAGNPTASIAHPPVAMGDLRQLLDLTED